MDQKTISVAPSIDLYGAPDGADGHHLAKVDIQ
jgi:hypothetical protein